MMFILMEEYVGLRVKRKHWKRNQNEEKMVDKTVEGAETIAEAEEVRAEAAEEEADAVTSLSKTLSKVGKSVKGFMDKRKDDKNSTEKTSGVSASAEKNVVSVGFWLLLTLALQVIDFFWWHFGGVDYNIILSAIRTGGFELAVKIIIPIYILIILIVILALKAAESRKIGFFLFAIFAPLIVINHFALDYNMFGVSISIISLIASMIIVILKLPDEERRGFLSWVLLLLTLSAIWSLGGLLSGLHHIVMAILIWVFVIKKPDEPFTSANYKISVLLIVDFFVFGMLQSFSFLKETPLVANRFIIPIWFLFIVFYTIGQKRSTFAKIVMAIVIILYIIAFVDGAYGWANVNAQMEGSPEEREEAKSFLDDLWSKLKSIPGQIGKEVTGGLEEATGGYYQGRVEGSEEEQLGVYLENVESANKRFFENEQVVIWGDLKANTLDDPIYIYMSCESGDVEGKIIPPVLSNPEYLGNIENGYKIQKLDQIGFECRFEPGQLKTGTNNIKVTAEFNFKTSASLKTYFMDVERILELTKEDKFDPLGEYEITDKKPIAGYSEGPIMLGIGTVDPPVKASSEAEAYSHIGVTIKRQWPGKIKNIAELTIQIPSMLQLESSNDELFCRDEFKKIEENEEGYSVYTLTEDSIKKIKTPITQYRSWRCSITVPLASEVLGNTPVTTYEYEADAKYTYEVEKLINVYVRAVQEEET